MKKKLLIQLRDEIRIRHYSIRTEEAYSQWVKRFILFHNKRHPSELGAQEISSFLTHLINCFFIFTSQITGQVMAGIYSTVRSFSSQNSFLPACQIIFTR